MTFAMLNISINRWTKTHTYRHNKLGVTLTKCIYIVETIKCTLLHLTLTKGL